jgi:GNAT superfamily N-acetyltransferase
MKIRKAYEKDFETVKSITHTTIKAVYPHYYPTGAVDFFLKHHSDENIRRDIEIGSVYLLSDENGEIAGTVTVAENHINRLFVLPEYQGRGYGSELIRFAEELISEKYAYIEIDASFSAKSIYIRKGYQFVEYNIIRTENGDFLCYDVMKKEL